MSASPLEGETLEEDAYVCFGPKRRHVEPRSQQPIGLDFTLIATPLPASLLLMYIPSIAPWELPAGRAEVPIFLAAALRPSAGITPE
jgi:hypothetical protein